MPDGLICRISLRRHSGAREARARNPWCDSACGLMDSGLALRAPRNDQGGDGFRFALPILQATSPAATSRMPAARPSGSAETRNARRRSDRPRCDISGLSRTSRISLLVIASEAKQSMARPAEEWIASLRSQSLVPATKQPDGQNSAFLVGQISGLNCRVPPDKRGVRTSRTRGGMRWTLVHV